MTTLSELHFLYEEIVPVAERAVSGGIPIVSREMVSAYSDTEDTLQPGERKIQVRVQPSEQDVQSDANATVLGADVEVTVVRSLHIEEHPNDERLYRSEEMLFGMDRLLERDRWIDQVSRIQDLTINPTISEAPERTGNTITYTVAFSVEL